MIPIELIQNYRGYYKAWLEEIDNILDYPSFYNSIDYSLQEFVDDYGVPEDETFEIMEHALKEESDFQTIHQRQLDKLELLKEEDEEEAEYWNDLRSTYNQCGADAFFKKLK